MNCTNCQNVCEEGTMFCPKCGTPVKEEPQQKVCSKCGLELKDGTMFCPKCGTPVKEEPQQKVCSKCGLELEEGTMFCPKCGTPAGAQAPAPQAAPAAPAAAALKMEHMSTAVFSFDVPVFLKDLNAEKLELGDFFAYMTTSAEHSISLARVVAGTALQSKLQEHEELMREPGNSLIAQKEITINGLQAKYYQRKIGSIYQLKVLAEKNGYVYDFLTQLPEEESEKHKDEMEAFIYSIKVNDSPAQNASPAQNTGPKLNMPF